MKIRSMVIVDGLIVAGSETMTWETMVDGEITMRLQPGIWRGLAEYDHASTFVAVKVRFDDLPTVLEIDRRLRQLEEK